MTFLNKFQQIRGGTRAAQVEDSISDEDRIATIQTNVVSSKDAGPTHPGAPTDDPIKDVEKPSEEAQFGVQKIEAVTMAWSKASLATVLILYAIGYRNFSEIIVFQLTPLLAASGY